MIRYSTAKLELPLMETITEKGGASTLIVIFARPLEFRIYYLSVYYTAFLF